MKLTYKTLMAIFDGFSLIPRPNTVRNLPESTGLFIMARVSGRKVYTPCLLALDVGNTIVNTDVSIYEDIAYSAGDAHMWQINTAPMIVNALLSRGSSVRFYNIETSKGYSYKGIHGIILDGDCNPLLVCCHVFDLDGGNSSKVMFISPKVFTNTDIVSKFIVRSIIPNIEEIRRHKETKGMSIYISDFIDGFISSPRIPDIVDFNDSVYDTLENHIGEIIDEP